MSLAVPVKGEMEFSFQASTPMVVRPGSVLDVPIVAFGIDQPLTGVSLSVHVRHREMDMLTLGLISPHSRTVLLSAFHGGTAPSFGESAARPLVFTDEASRSIAQALPPLVGVFRPVGTLAVFRGLPPAVSNGSWHLVVMDLGRSGASALVASAVLRLRV